MSPARPRVDATAHPSTPEIEPPNALHAVAPGRTSWSTTNAAEACPGVMTPLTASAWAPGAELCLREPFYAMGALRRSRRLIPADPGQRATNPFYGRLAVNVDFLCEIGYLVPGLSGDSLARDMFSYVPTGFVSKSSNKRLPFVLAKMPVTFATIAKTVERERMRTSTWWSEEIPATPMLSLEALQRRVTEAVERYKSAITHQAIITIVAVQPAYDQLGKLAEPAGVQAATLVRGHGKHEENAVLDDMWAVSRDRLTLEEFLARHGYHGPAEGESISTSWREDPSPVMRTVAQYRAMPDDAAPFADHARREQEARDAELQLLSSAAGFGGRLKAKLVLKLARQYVPARGIGKVSYLQSIDVLRASARQIGTLLAEQGRLSEPDDAFYLTDVELAGESLRDPATDLKPLVAQRRAQRERYLTLEIPTAWTGNPVATVTVKADHSGETVLTGMGTSPGVATGRAVVVLDPSDVEVDSGDILVAHTTDPAWVSIMFLADALVVDIGGLMSHAAVVARELDIPCVMNTIIGTEALHTGDVIRVDGNEGTVEILQRAGQPSPAG